MSVAMPDITKAQLLAAFTWIVGQLVTMGLIDNDQAQLFSQVGITFISSAWIIADAIIRQGRAKALARSDVHPVSKTI